MRLRRFGSADERVVVFDVDDVERVVAHPGDSSWSNRIDIFFRDGGTICCRHGDFPNLHGELMSWIVNRDWSELDKDPITVDRQVLREFLQELQEEP